jgi:GNAT superfamily N-acetyltransferase
MSFEIRDEAYDSPNALVMMAAVQAEYVERYGGPDSTPVATAEFTPPAGRFVVGYLDGVPVAMGGLRLRAAGGLGGLGGLITEVEVKRMYVAPPARGGGLSRLVLAALEDRARELGATRVVLETGQRQPEAISLYTSSGYERIAGFGHYRDAPLSLSFAKTL